jgi:long-subunit fatty acid transport protein
MKKFALTYTSLLVGLSLFSAQALAQSIEIPSSFNPVGSGARALGLGGSFIAMADDATAASWNPAALMQLRKPEVALVVSSTERKEDLLFEVTNDSSSNSTNNTDLNYFAISAPCAADTCGLNMVFSLNYQRLYDLSRDFNYSLTEEFTSTDVQFRQTGALYAIGLAYALQVNDTLNLGITLNYWDNVLGQNGFTSSVVATEVDSAPGDFFDNVESTADSDFEGVNFNLGALWIPYQKDEKKLTVGFVYKSSFDADIASTTSFVSQSGNLSEPDDFDNFDQGSFAASTITFPSSYGVGFAYQINDALTASLDLYRTNWSEFEEINEQGLITSPISGSQQAPDVQNSTQVKLGVEYRIISQSLGANHIIPLRAGFFIDPVIEDGSNEDSYGLALGAGVAFEHWVFDVAYQYRWADNLGRSQQQELGLVFDTQEHQLYLSSYYRF